MNLLSFPQTLKSFPFCYKFSYHIGLSSPPCPICHLHSDSISSTPKKIHPRAHPYLLVFSIILSTYERLNDLVSFWELIFLFVVYLYYFILNKSKICMHQNIQEAKKLKFQHLVYIIISMFLSFKSSPCHLCLEHLH